MVLGGVHFNAGMGFLSSSSGSTAYSLPDCDEMGDRAD
jgi:hypothetical protein